MFDLFSSFKKDVKDFIASAHDRITALEAKVEALTSYVSNDVKKVEDTAKGGVAEVAAVETEVKDAV